MNTSEIDDAEIAAQIIESDARYFEMGARVLRLPGCVLAWVPELTHLAAGCVVHRIDTEVAEANPSAWLAKAEHEIMRVGSRRARLYLRGAAPALEHILRMSGYQSRIETAFIAPAAPSHDDHSIILREVRSEDEWEMKLAVHRAEKEGADGYKNDAGEWVELIRRKWHAGQKRCFLIQRGKELCGSVGIVECRQAWRLKNLVIMPAHQRQGVGLGTLAAAAGMAAAAGKSYVGLIALDGYPGVFLYKHAGYRAVSTLHEWTRSLKETPEEER